MKLRIAELDGGEYFHGSAFDDSGKELFAVKLIKWLKKGLIIESFEDGRIFKVDENRNMVEIVN